MSAVNGNSYLEFADGHINSGKLVFGNTQIITRDAAGTPDAIIINSDSAALSALWKVNSKYSFGSMASTNQVFINSDTAQEGGLDTSFWVSGSLGSRGTGVRGTAVFGGDTVVSGGLHINAPSSNKSHFRVETVNLDYAINVHAANNTVAFGSQYTSGLDSHFFVSGSKSALERGSTVGGVSTFGGDVVISGSLRAKSLHYTTHKYSPGGNPRHYVRFDTIGSDASPGLNNKMIAPYS